MRTIRFRRAAGAALALLGGLTFVTASASPAAALNGDLDPEDFAAFWEARVHDVEGSTDPVQLGDTPLPECGPRNINGRDGADMTNNAQWAVGASAPSGSQIEIGDTITVTASVASFTSNTGNDGPDPLFLELVPSGPVERVGEIEADHLFIPYNGNGFVGPVAPYGEWGFEFDSNSSPILQPGDGAAVQMTFTMQATAPGVISFSELRVFGHDATPKAGDFDCAIPVPLFWSVDDVDGPTSGPDVAATDARYEFESFGDANGGQHAIDIDVLANDDDPEVAGGPGDTDEVRVQDWQPASVEGGTVSCGTPAQKGEDTFAQMSTGPCRYQAPVGYAGPDQFGYVVQSVTGLTRFVNVSVQVLPNRAPLAPVHDPDNPPYVLQSNQLIGGAPLGAVVPDPDGDPVSCELVSDVPVGEGDLTFGPGCAFDYDPEAFTGTTSFAFRACDTHPSLQGGQLGPATTRAPGYEDADPDDAVPTADLSATTVRRCRDVTRGIRVIDVNQPLYLPPVAGTDVAVVDAGYAGEGIGAYHIAIPILANDYDPNDPEFPELIGGIDELPGSFDDSLGTIEFDEAEQLLRFSPADGVEGFVELQYRVCDDGDAQNPPMPDDPDTPLVDESLGVCGIGNVSIFVLPNEVPTALGDEVLTSSIAAVEDLDVGANDTDPEAEGLACTPGTLDATPAGLVAAATIDEQCLVDLTPVVGAEGVAELTYEVCDLHQLSQTGTADVPYGDDGRDADDLAPRCSSGVLTATIVAPAQDDPGLFELDPGPTCADDAASTAAGTAASVAVLGNDADVDFANQPSPLEVSNAGVEDLEGASAAGGTVAPNADGTAVVYTPPAGFSGTDTFSYGAQDTVGKGCGAVVTVTVLAAQAPGGSGTGTGGTGTGTGTGGTGRGELPRTGSSTGFGQAQVGFGLALLGAGLVLADRGLRPGRRRATGLGG